MMSTPKSTIKQKIKRRLWGMNTTDGLIYKILIYFLLVIISFIFVYPIIFMIITSLKSVTDLADTSIKWIPTMLEWNNYKTALSELKYFQSLYKTFIVALIPSLINTIVACLTAYGFAKFTFPGRKILFGIMLATFIIPKALINIPQFAWYSKLGLLGSLFTYILPSTFGQGLYSALYILILYSTICQIPKQLEESARIDGANNIQIFFKIVIPLIIPLLLTVFLFSFVWYWNDATTAAMYLGQAGKDFWTTLPVALQNYNDKVSAITNGGQLEILYSGIKMACTLISIIPLLIIYFILQRYFVESIDRSGITGE